MSYNKISAGGTAIPSAEKKQEKHFYIYYRTSERKNQDLGCKSKPKSKSNRNSNSKDVKAILRSVGRVFKSDR